MKKVLLAVLMSSALTLPAQAQDAAAVCKLLHTQNARADAAYKAGVDAHGKPVVPADMGAAMLIPTDVIQIPLNYDLAQKFQIKPGTKLEAGLGSLEIRNNNVSYNGQDLTQRAQVLCGMPEKPTTPTPQETADAEAKAAAAAAAIKPAAATPPTAPVVLAPTAAVVATPPKKEYSLGKATRTMPGEILPENDSPLPPEVAASIKGPDMQNGEILWGQGN